MINRYAAKYKEVQMKLLEEVLAKKVKRVEAAQLLGVSRPTLNKWLCRYRRFGSAGLEIQKRKKYPAAHNRTSTELEDKVIKLSEIYWYDGVETLSDRLWAEAQVNLNPSTIYRILKRRGVRYNGSWNGTRKRARTQLYCHGNVGQELQVDTKYPFGYKQGKVIYTAIDDATRWTYAQTYSTANAANSLRFLAELNQRFPGQIQKIRTDNGTEFANYQVRDYLISQDIEWRRNTPYCPEENGKIERFHRTLNEKLIRIHLSPSHTLEELNYHLALWLHWYNHHKRHRGLGMNGLTPFQKILLLTPSQNVNLTLQCNSSLQI